jgi:hypothetical protein
MAHPPCPPPDLRAAARRAGVSWRATRLVPYYGIMSALDFKMDLKREHDPKGDRVNIVMSGKFLPYKTF